MRSPTANPARRQIPLMERLATFTSTPPADDAHPIHGLHPYPGKYIPQLPRAVITEHTNERNTVLDPFCGSGTTLVEAALLGRKSVGVDSNPVAALMSRAKTSALSTSARRKAEVLLNRVAETDPAELPTLDTSASDPLTHWFQDNMVRELTWLRDLCRSVHDKTLRDFLLCVFGSVVVLASNQDSDTRYTAVDKDLQDGYALYRFVRKLSSALDWIADFSSIDKATRNRPVVYALDTTDVRQKIKPRSIDLIVTSPPYPNSYDYYLYHKLRMWWLGFDHRPVQQKEIGSRYEHSSRKASLEVFTTRMAPVMSALASVLKPSKLAYFFVGDSVLAGEHIDMADVYVGLAKRAGLGFVDSTSYELKLVSRSFRDTRRSAGNGHRHPKLQHVVVLEGRGESNSSSRRHIARATASEPTISLDDVTDGAVVAIASEEGDRHVHSLAAYPSKFIPEIPRWAIKSYSQPGDVVIDPFAGSGTTAVEALLLGRSAMSADLSPFATLMARAKTTRVAEEQLRVSALALERAAAKPSRLPRAPRAVFPLEEFWFSTPHLREFAGLLAFIESEIPSELGAFFRIALASTIRAFSFQDPGQIKVKRDPRKVMRGTPAPSELLRGRLPAAVERLSRFIALADHNVSHTISTASADAFLDDLPARTADLLVTSPPYINAMNYAMIQRYELVLLGLVEHSDLNAHQAEYFGTERVYARDYKQLHRFPKSHVLARALNPALRAVFAREPKRSYIAFRFFERMDRTAQAMVRSVRPGGHLVLVAGSNVIRGIPIDTFALLVSLLESHGAERDLSFHYEIVKQTFKLRRHKTASLIAHDGVAVLRIR
jgi:DNA modification methylase